jgi:hypothetical protein
MSSEEDSFGELAYRTARAARYQQQLDRIRLAGRVLRGDRAAADEALEFTPEDRSASEETPDGARWDPDNAAGPRAGSGLEEGPIGLIRPGGPPGPDQCGPAPAR